MNDFIENNNCDSICNCECNREKHIDLQLQIDNLKIATVIDHLTIEEKARNSATDRQLHTTESTLNFELIYEFLRF